MTNSPKVKDALRRFDALIDLLPTHVSEPRGVLKVFLASELEAVYEEMRGILASLKKGPAHPHTTMKPQDLNDEYDQALTDVLRLLEGKGDTTP